MHIADLKPHVSDLLSSVRPIKIKIVGLAFPAPGQVSRDFDA